MIKRATILHGTDGDTSMFWMPWLKEWLEEQGYEVFCPRLPDNHTPNIDLYDKFLKKSGWDFTDNIIIGHSSGATTLLNLLNSTWMPNIKSAVLVGALLNENLVKSAEWYEGGQFENLFMDDYDTNKIIKRAGTFYFVHGDDDPYCDFEDAKKLCKDLKGKMIVIKNGHHLAGTSGITQLPELINELTLDDVI